MTEDHVRSSETGTLSLIEKELRKALSDGRLPEVAEIVAGLIPRYLHGDVSDKYFEFWQRHGFHLTPVQFYSPIPDTRELPDELFEKESEMLGVDLNVNHQLHLLRDVFPRFRDEYESFSPKELAGSKAFYFDNPMFSGTDALVLYCMVRLCKPNLIIEVGSGHSTRILSQAASRNGNTRIKCIEPSPDDTLETLPRVTEVIRRRVQDVPIDLFHELAQGDILFIDTSHTVKCGGDVNYLCLDVLPRVKNGVIVHFHDIFLPKDYPSTWVRDRHLFWNEKYLLQAFLMFNSEFEIIFLDSFMGLRHQEEMKRTFPKSPWWGGGSCWIRRKSGVHVLRRWLSTRLSQTQVQRNGQRCSSPEQQL